MNQWILKLVICKLLLWINKIAKQNWAVLGLFVKFYVLIYIYLNVTF